MTTSVDISAPAEIPAPVGRIAGGREIAFSLLFLVFALYLLFPLVGVFLFSIATTWFDTVLPAGYTLDHVTATINDPLFVPTVGRSLIGCGRPWTSSICVWRNT